jgi:hypothetical protein
VLGVA